MSQPATASSTTQDDQQKLTEDNTSPSSTATSSPIAQFDTENLLLAARSQWNRFRESEHVQNTKQVFLSYGDLLARCPPLRILWFASIVSQTGDWFNEIALLTMLNDFYPNSGILLSFLLISRELPPFLLGPVVGIVADKYDKRQVMIMTDMLRAVTVLLFLLIRSHWLASMLYVLSFMQFSISAFFTPAKAALIPMYVSAGDLVTANTLDGFSYSAVLFLASALGAFCTALFGYYFNFLLDSISYLISAALTYKLFEYPYQETHSNPNTAELPMEKGVDSQAGSVPRGNVDLASPITDQAPSTPITTAEMMQRLHAMESQIRTDSAQIEAQSKVNLSRWLILIQEGYEYLKSEKYIFVVANAKAVGALIWGGQELINIRYANTDYPWGPHGTISLGFVYAIVGLCVGLGPFLLQVKYSDTPRNNEKCVLAGFIMLCIGSVLMPMVPNMFFLLVINTVRAMGSGTIWVFSSSILMRAVRPQVRGRVFAYENGLQTFLSVSSKFLIGLLLDVFGYSTHSSAVFPAVVSVLALTLAIYFYMYREQENIDYAPVVDEQLHNTNSPQHSTTTEMSSHTASSSSSSFTAAESRHPLHQDASVPNEETVSLN